MISTSKNKISCQIRWF